MKVHQFLDHYGITENPFAQEDAGSDRVFQANCLTGTRHSAWDKVYGDPRAPATAVVFGEQGSGKTALRYQIVSKLTEYNQENPRQRAFIIQYDDFNPFLDSFRERLSARQRKAEKALQNWQLWDHMDAILTLSTTRLADAIRSGPERTDEAHRISQQDLDNLNHLQQRDILLLAACYDHNREYGPLRRWSALRRKLKFPVWMTWWDRAFGVLVTLLTVFLVIWLNEDWRALFQWWVAAIIVAGWLPYLWNQLRLAWYGWRIKRQIRIFDHQISGLRKIFSRFQRSELVGQPLPTRPRGDDRYELLMKLQSVLGSLGFSSIVVLVDRVDEPHLVNGAPEKIRDLVWPMFDNKFLKHPGIAFKLLLPDAVSGYLGREEKAFYERSRLDKQNLIPSLSWTGQGLYDIANDRIRACAELAEGKKPTVGDIFEESISQQELIAIFDRLRAPRHLFKFLYRLLVDHCSKYTEDAPQWKIQRDTLQATLAVFTRDLQAYDAKRGTG
jgi:hypothetical protein